jgi:hypothetical protein
LRMGHHRLREKLSRNGTTDRTGLYRLRKNSSNLFQKHCFVTGHDFSRAETSTKKVGL